MLLASSIIILLVCAFVATAPQVAVKIILAATWVLMGLAAIGGTLYDVLR